MKTFNAVGLSLVTLILIVPAVSAGTISNGAYASRYPDSLRIEIKGSRYHVVSVDFPDEGWRNRSETKFQYVKRGVFYNLNDRDYYCSVALLPTRRPHMCSKNGWKPF
jgi:hypothetical protein